MSLFVRHTAHSERQLNEICWAVIPQEVESIKTPTKPGRLSSHFGTTCTTWKFHLLNGIMMKLYFSCFHRVFLCFPGIFHSVFLCSTVFLCFRMFSYVFLVFHVRFSRSRISSQRSVAGLCTTDLGERLGPWLRALDQGNLAGRRRAWDWLVSQKYGWLVGGLEHLFFQL